MELTRVEVRKQILTCMSCSLAGQCRSPVPFRGPTPSKLLVLGEAPGKQEDEQGKPFVGPSGTLAESWIKRAGIEPDSIVWANTVSCFPNRTPTAGEVNDCRHNRDAQIALARPSHVLVFGGVALSAWWSIRIGVLRGTWWKGTVSGLDYRPWFLATWHPSAVLRNRTLEKEAFADVLKWKVRAATSSFIPPPYTCLDCGGYADVWRDHTGKDVTNLPGEESDGSLAWCQKHDDFRMGKTGRGRTRGTKDTDDPTTPNGSQTTPTKPKRQRRSSKKESPQLGLDLGGAKNE